MAVTRGLLFLRTPLLFFFFYRTVIFFSSLFRVKLDDAQTRKKDEVSFLEMMIPQDRTYKSVKAAFSFPFLQCTKLKNQIYPLLYFTLSSNVMMDSLQSFFFFLSLYYLAVSIRQDRQLFYIPVLTYLLDDF